MEDWEADETATVERRLRELVHGAPLDRAGEGRRHVAARHGALTLTQKFQMLAGTLGGAAITDAKMSGAEIAFTVGGGTRYTGRVDGNTMKGTISTGGSFTATKK